MNGHLYLHKIRSRIHSSCRSRSRCRPAEENEFESGGEGGRGANPEEVVNAVRGQRVVALAALRKKTIGSGGQAGLFWPVFVLWRSALAKALVRQNSSVC